MHRASGSNVLWTFSTKCCKFELPTRRVRSASSFSWCSLFILSIVPCRIVHPFEPLILDHIVCSCTCTLDDCSQVRWERIANASACEASWIEKLKFRQAIRRKAVISKGIHLAWTCSNIWPIAHHSSARLSDSSFSQKTSERRLSQKIRSQKIFRLSRHHALSSFLHFRTFA